MAVGIRNNKETRRQKRLERFGTNHPACANCGENDDRCLELHHIAGRMHSEDTVILCRNCHRKVSDDQKDHPKCGSTSTKAQSIGYQQLGLAGLFALLAISLKESGEYLIETDMEES
jgi:hypothetical protein